MWKIFKCKRGEERGFIPGEYLDGGIALPLGKGIEIVINRIRNALSPGIRILEDVEKVVVQYQREVMGRPYYKKFLEIYKHERHLSFDDYNAGNLPEFRVITHKCKPTTEVVMIFDALESYS